MHRTLILGYGNILRGDDALGPMAVEHLAKRYRERANVEVDAVHQLTPDLAERMYRYDRVIFVDACEGGQPGQIVYQAVSSTATVPQTLTHHVTPEQLMAVSQVLYGSVPEALVLGITAESFAVGESLSTPVRNALPRLIEYVIRIVDRGTDPSSLSEVYRREGLRAG